jgi:hypothetical protein
MVIDVKRVLVADIASPVFSVIIDATKGFLAIGEEVKLVPLLAALGRRAHVLTGDFPEPIKTWIHSGIEKRKFFLAPIVICNVLLCAVANAAKRHEER